MNNLGGRVRSKTRKSQHSKKRNRQFYGRFKRSNKMDVLGGRLS